MSTQFFGSVTKLRCRAHREQCESMRSSYTRCQRVSTALRIAYGRIMAAATEYAELLSRLANRNSLDRVFRSTVESLFLIFDMEHIGWAAENRISTIYLFTLRHICVPDEVCAVATKRATEFARMWGNCYVCSRDSQMNTRRMDEQSSAVSTKRNKTKNNTFAFQCVCDFFSFGFLLLSIYFCGSFVQSFACGVFASQEFPICNMKKKTFAEESSSLASAMRIEDSTAINTWTSYLRCMKSGQIEIEFELGQKT